MAADISWHTTQSPLNTLDHRHHRPCSEQPQRAGYVISLGQRLGVTSSATHLLTGDGEYSEAVVNDFAANRHL